jgi:hypothetical protein
LAAPGTLTARGDAPDPQDRTLEPRKRTLVVRAWAEALAVVASPAIAFFVLRLRPMAPTDLPDPSMHTAYVVDPRDVFRRYQLFYESSSRLREAARVGFLVPARLDYLAFGGVGGFFATRYLFALIAVIPAYLLLRRLYGPAAGVLGIVVIFSSPVVITAWGTDYPDSVVVSYLLGALACLAMPSTGRYRRLWVLAAGALMTLAIWAHSIAVPLVATTLVVYVVVRLMRQRGDLFGDLVLLGLAAIAVTGALSVGSGLLIGQYNYISPTWQAYKYLSTPAQVAAWHAKGWKWVEYLPYLLVPPAVVAASIVVFWRRLRSIPTATLVVLLTCAAQLVVFAYLQFLGSVETLEEHYFSSTLWASVCLALAVTLCEASKSFLGRDGLIKWLPALIVLLIPLIYEIAPKETPYKWHGVGLYLALVLVAGAAIASLARFAPRRVLSVGSTVLGVVLMTACALYLAADPVLVDPYLNSVKDPPPAYNDALGGNGSKLVDLYAISTQLPSFVGNATYDNEQMVMWWPISEVGTLINPTGMYHYNFNSLPSSPPKFTPGDAQFLKSRRPDELLILNTSSTWPSAALKALSPYHPIMLHHGVLKSGDEKVYVWLLDLRYYGIAF